MAKNPTVTDINIEAKYLPKTSNIEQSVNGNLKSLTLQIKEEQLDVAKEWIQTGQVKIYREIITENQNFSIPVMREELVIEKKILTSDTPEQENPPIETIRITLSEEKIEFTKHSARIEDVSIYKQQVEEIKHIEAKLKKEEAKVKVSGSIQVKDKSNS